MNGFFNGEATSEVGLQAGLRNDFWTAIQPNLAAVRREAAVAQRNFERIAGRVAGRSGDPAAMAEAGSLLGRSRRTSSARSLRPTPRTRRRPPSG